jgi:SAM-dependent methyltransferase
MRTTGKLKVDARHFEYLRLQKGSLDQYTHDPELWHRKYEEDLERQIGNIAPEALPRECWGFLDIGSGLGGIDILIRREYLKQDIDPVIHLLDGINDPPRMVLHRQTFNNMAIARDFHQANGVPASRFATFGPTVTGFSRPFDLVVSFGSWCFHFPPSVYLPALLNGGLEKGTWLILDVRNGKRKWFDELSAALYPVRPLLEKQKFKRWLFLAK